MADVLEYLHLGQRLVPVGSLLLTNLLRPRRSSPGGRPRKKLLGGDDTWSVSCILIEDQDIV